MFTTRSIFVTIYVLLDLLTFLELFLLSCFGVINYDLVHLLSVIFLLQVDLLVESVQLFLQLFDGYLLELDVTLQLLVFGQEFFIFD